MATRKKIKCTLALCLSPYSIPAEQSAPDTDLWTTMLSLCGPAEICDFLACLSVEKNSLWQVIPRNQENTHKSIGCLLISMHKPVSLGCY